MQAVRFWDGLSAFATTPGLESVSPVGLPAVRSVDRHPCDAHQHQSPQQQHFRRIVDQAGKNRYRQDSLKSKQRVALTVFYGLSAEFPLHLKLSLVNPGGGKPPKEAEIAATGRRGWTRTSDPLLRRQVLYPPELRAHRFGINILPGPSVADRARLWGKLWGLN